MAGGHELVPRAWQDACVDKRGHPPFCASLMGVHIFQSYPPGPAGAGAELEMYRFNWNSPIHMSPTNPDVGGSGLDHDK
jgi:hypothetical protein